MFFLGTTFFGGKYILNPSAGDLTDITEARLSEGTFDHLYMNENPNMTPENIYDEWTYDTVMNASFNSSIESGNSDFSLRNTDTMVFKIREEGMLDWHTIETRKINTIEDFNISGIYKYARNNTNYELMLLSVINGIENSHVICGIRSEFCGIYLIDRDNMYGTVYDIDDCNTTRNISAVLQNVMNDRYATVYSNSASNYDSGSVTASFIKTDASHAVDTGGGRIYRQDFIDFLCNRKPKILKIEDGRKWLIKVTDMPSDTQNGHPDLRQITFSWAEVGDAESPKDLYYNRLSDVTYEWW